MERLNRYARPLLIAALAAAVLLGGAALAQNRQIDQLNNQIRANSARAVYESAEMMRGVESNLRKLTVSASGPQLQQYLSDIAKQAQGAESAFAALPLSADHGQAAAKAINQMGDYASVLSGRLARGGAITEADADNIGKLITAAGAINEGMQLMIETLEQGGSIDTITFGELPEAGSVPAEDGTYPTLIYDGPFSDAAQGNEFRALSGSDVTAQQAEDMLRGYIGNDRIDSIEMTGESEIPVAAYEFRIRAGDMELSAAVTRQGGQVLYILPETAVGAATVPVPQCVASAGQFLARNGYGDMQVSYYYHCQNVLTVNFAARQDGVVLYPDLIKVQVSMQDGRVIGVECANYLKNHLPRTLPEATVTREEAMARVNPELDVQYVRMALIPVDAQEIFTYEIAAKDASDNQYLIYIDAATGQERQIFQLLSDENGTLAE